MKIINLKENANMYTSNVYLVLGTWNAIEDVNTLVDVGRDPAIMDIIYEASTGVGKSRVDQVILTHSHYDHASLLPTIREAFHPKVCAFSHSLEGVDHHLRGWETLRLGDRNFEVIHTPGHTPGGISLFTDGHVFVGDTLFAGSIGRTDFPGGNFETLKSSIQDKLFALGDAVRVYTGHGPETIIGHEKQHNPFVGANATY